MFGKKLLPLLIILAFCGIAVFGEKSFESNGIAQKNLTGNSKRRVVADFDGDGKTDLSVIRPSSGDWHIWRSSDSTHQVTHFGRSSDVFVPGDYDGDKKTDFAVFRWGVWYILNSSDSTVRYEYFGIGNDFHAVGDYDGDGKDDLALFRSQNATWYIVRSSDREFYQIQFGLSSDRAIPADYDGDGKTDIAVHRGSNDPSEADFYILNSSDLSVSACSWGISKPGDQAVPADYDGDGKADIAVFRLSGGIWYILKSTGGYSVEALSPFGGYTTPGDYDGDGKYDIALFVWLGDVGGFWHVKNSSTGEVRIQNFGSVGDWAVPGIQHP